MRSILIFISTMLTCLHLMAFSSLDIYIPTLQLRFENKDNQEIGFNNYDSFLLSGTYDSKWWGGVSFDYFKETTGSSPQLKVENNFYEVSAALGYVIFTAALNEKQSLWIDLVPMVDMGVNWGRVKTQVLGDSKVDSSGTDLSLGMGGLAQLRFFSWIFHLDFRVKNSAVYQPSFVPVTSARIGFRIDL